MAQPFDRIVGIEIVEKSTCKTNVILHSVMYNFGCGIDNVNQDFSLR
jgi:hypothetical protein